MKQKKLPTGIQVIGLAGHKGSGKDTLGDHLGSYINTEGKREAFTIGLADPLKLYCAQEYGLDLTTCHADDHTKNTTLSPVAWNTMPKEIQERFEHTKADTTNMTYREVLQIVGTELGRDKYGENVWINKFVDSVASIKSDKPITIIVTDVRYDNEAQFIMDNGGHVVRIISDYKAVDMHVSEMGVSRYNYEVEGKGKASLKASKQDIETLYGYITLHERVRDFVNEEEK